MVIGLPFLAAVLTLGAFASPALAQNREKAWEIHPYFGYMSFSEVDGEKVVDLWGGIRNKQTGEPWERDTMVLVYSTTKGLAAMTLALARSRGWLDYEQPVCRYWPEFAQQEIGRAHV